MLASGQLRSISLHNIVMKAASFTEGNYYMWHTVGLRLSTYCNFFLKMKLFKIKIDSCAAMNMRERKIFRKFVLWFNSLYHFELSRWNKGYF
jgi:hypothetical protein